MALRKRQEQEQQGRTCGLPEVLQHGHRAEFLPRIHSPLDAEREVGGTPPLQGGGTQLSLLPSRGDEGPL